MKRLLILILFLFSLNLISAIDLEMNSEFSQGETFYATLEGDLQNTLVSEDVIFYRGHVDIPVDVSILNVGNKYYISGQLIGKHPGDYSIEINNLQYIELKELKETTLVKNFTISEDIADFSINPKIITTDKNFDLNLENLKSSTSFIKIESLFSSSSQVDISAGDTKAVNFGIEDINESGLYFINLSSLQTFYEVPVLVTIKEEIKEPELVLFETEPEKIIINMSSNVSYEYSRFIRLRNDGNKDLEDIIISLSNSLNDYAELSSENVNILNENSSLTIKVSFNSRNESEVVEGEIDFWIDSQNLSYSLPILLNISQSYIPLEEDLEGDEDLLKPISGGNSVKSCSEINGVICSDNEKCEGTINDLVPEKNCCIGTCEEKDESSSKGKLIGWGLIILIALFLIWFYFKKYKGAKPSINLLKASKPKI